MKFNNTHKKPARSTPQGGAPAQAKANGQAKSPEQAAAPVIAHTPVLERVAFTDLGLSEPVLRALRDEGYEHPTPIQAKAIPHVLEGRDILGCAQTGTGKTAAFALPILHSLMGEKIDTAQRGPVLPRALILSPTRELATQITDSFRQYGRHTGLSQTVIFGGVGQNPQVRALQRGIDVLVATPGRLIDLMEQRLVNLSRVRIFVLDEADRMLDMGFIQPIRRIEAALPREPRRQTLLFSATMPGEIMKLADTLLRNPVKVAVTPVASAAPKIEQIICHVPRTMKGSLLLHMLGDPGVSRAVVFTRTKHGADKVARRLQHSGISADAIHGNKAQNQRTRALDAFRAGRTRVLVATDVAARGLDVDAISHVINFDLPVEPEAYVHRIGRTARAGASGMAVSFCSPEERGLLRDIERLTGKPIATRPIPTDLPVPPPMPEHSAHEHEQRRGPKPPMRARNRGDSQGRPGRAPRPAVDAGERDGVIRGGAAPSRISPRGRTRRFGTFRPDSAN